MLLPDSYPALYRTLEILWEKDRGFLAQEPGATEGLPKLNRELDGTLNGILAEVAQGPDFLPVVHQQILRLFEVEMEAIHLLRSIIG